MNREPTPAPPSRRRALVLGGGGSTGHAWLVGVLAGLLETGLDVTDADLVVGTSAGSTVAVQVSAASMADLFGTATTPIPGTPPAEPARRPEPARPATDHLDRLRAVIAASEDIGDLRRRIGAAAIDRLTASGESAAARWRAVVADRLPSTNWPERRTLLTAVDARTGEPVTFDRRSGVDVVDAVAASCSSALAYPIGARLYVDGGYRCGPENADLATGYERVLVLSPLGGRSLHPPEWGTHLAAQVDALRTQGSSVETVLPDAGDEHLFGANAMDLSLRPHAARAGHKQDRAVAARLAGLWE